MAFLLLSFLVFLEVRTSYYLVNILKLCLEDRWKDYSSSIRSFITSSLLYGIALGFDFNFSCLLIIFHQFTFCWISAKCFWPEKSLYFFRVSSICIWFCHDIHDQTNSVDYT